MHHNGIRSVFKMQKTVELHTSMYLFKFYIHHGNLNYDRCTVVTLENPAPFSREFCTFLRSCVYNYSSVEKSLLQDMVQPLQYYLNST